MQSCEALDPSAKEVPSCWANNDVMLCQPSPEMQVLSARAEHGENAVESKQQPEWRKIARRYLDWVSLLIVSKLACHACRRASISCSACALCHVPLRPCAFLSAALDSTRLLLNLSSSCIMLARLMLPGCEHQDHALQSMCALCTPTLSL